jgi:hypothetical protein
MDLSRERMESLIDSQNTPSSFSFFLLAHVTFAAKMFENMINRSDVTETYAILCSDT